MAKRTSKKSVGERVVNRFGLITNQQLRRRVREAYASGYEDGNDDPATSQYAAGGQGYDAYIKQVTLLHEMMVNAMKAKQTTDLQYVERLKELLMDFTKAYAEK